MLSAIGIGLIIAGALVALLGDRVVSESRSFLTRMVVWPPGRAKWLKIVVGLALIYAGVMLLAT